VDATGDERRATRCAVDLGADVIIGQGGQAGAHGDGIATTVLVPQVVDAAGVVPVVAAGGIADGRGLVAALAMGAQGVSMEVLRSPFLEHRAGRADDLDRRASELGAEMIEVLPVGEIARRSLAHAEDALARLQTYRAVRCGLAESSSGRHT
jgi:DhnA family fructose-bisphosphate aldolase class Ia